MDSKVIACLIARTNSKRLPLKVLRNVYGDKNLLDVIIERINIARNDSGIINDIYLCTSIEPEDEILEDVAEKNGIKIYRGSPDEVIERMLSVAEKEGADYLIRITGDNVFTDPYVMSYQLKFHLDNAFDYSRTEYLPIGVTSEIIDTDALKRCYKSIDPKNSEYLLLYMFDPKEYKCGILVPEDKRYNNYTLTVDTKEDLIRTKEIAAKIGKDYYKKSLLKIIKIIEKNKIPFSIIDANTIIKLPNNEIIEYSSFRQKTEEKINLSHKAFLPPEVL